MPPRRVWRAAPFTLLVVVAFCVIAGVVVPVLAYLILLRDQSPAVPVFLAALAVLAFLYGWRFGVHPRVVADARGVLVVNPMRRTRFPWPEITVLAPGGNGLLVASEAARAEAWCVQKSRWAARHGRRTRADRIVEELGDLLDLHDPPLEDDESGIRIRRARWAEPGLLTRIERAASKAALEHVFPPGLYAYPTTEVRRRWRRVLADPAVHVRILELFETPIGLVAYELAGTLRHLAVTPAHAGQGYGSLLLQFASEEIFAAGTVEAELWVLVQNQAARGFYARHGWLETDDRRRSEFPPRPEELRMVRPNPNPPKRRS